MLKVDKQWSCSTKETKLSFYSIQIKVVELFSIYRREEFDMLTVCMTYLLRNKKPMKKGVEILIWHHNQGFIQRPKPRFYLLKLQQSLHLVSWICLLFPHSNYFKVFYSVNEDIDNFGMFSYLLVCNFILLCPFSKWTPQ